MLLGKIIKVVAVEATVLAGVYVYKNYGKLCKSVIKDMFKKDVNESVCVNLSTPEEDLSKPLTASKDTESTNILKSSKPKRASKKIAVSEEIAPKKAPAKKRATVKKVKTDTSKD